MKGKVKFFNQGKGFGFIAGEDGKEYFVHISGVAPGVNLRDNDDVTFETTVGDRGPKATDVALDNGSSAPAKKAAPAEEADDDESFEDDDE